MIVRTLRFPGNLIGTPTEYNLALIVLSALEQSKLSNFAKCTIKAIKAKILMDDYSNERHYSGFHLSTSSTCTWYYISYASRSFSSNQKTKTNRAPHAHVFPRFASTKCVCFEI